MSKHTAENWKIKTLPTEEHNTIRDKYNVPVCYGALKANARLICTAPELLEALKQANEILKPSAAFCHMTHEEIEEIRSRITEAINKAEGGQC